MNNQFEVQQKNQKSGKGLIAVIIILVLLVLGLGGYIVYDKMLTKESTGTKDSETTETKVEADSLSKKLALALGKEKYEFIRNGLYMCGYNQLIINPEAVEGNKINAQVSDGITDYYHEILNIDNVKNKLTSNVFDKFVSSELVAYQNKYYIIDGCGGDPSYASTKYQIEVQNIQNNSITYTVTEYFYTVDNNGNIVEDLNKAEKYTTTFSLTKENDEWKISEYEDAYTSHINKQNNQ